MSSFGAWSETRASTWSFFSAKFINLVNKPAGGERDMPHPHVKPCSLVTSVRKSIMLSKLSSGCADAHEHDRGDLFSGSLRILRREIDLH
jgi:hypothetical protein